MMIINPYRFAGPAGAPEAWVAPLDGVLTSTGGGWGNYTFRNFISRPLLPGSATKARVTFSALAGGAMEILKAYIGQSRGATFDTTPLALTFGGNAGVTLSAGSDVVSDEINLPFTGTGDICVSAYIPSSGAAHFLSQRSAPALTGGNANFGDSASATGTFARGGTTYGVKKIELYTGGTWKTILAPQTNTESGWNGYTIRSKVNVGSFSLARTFARFGLTARASDFFVGHSAGGASPFDFASTPTRLTFGGINNTSAEDLITHLTDDFDLAALGVGTDLLFSFYTTGGTVGNRTSPPSNLSSRYKSGNSASNVSWHSGSATWANFLGLAVVDEKY